MSARRLAVLVAHLPPDSATVHQDQLEHDNARAASNRTPRNDGQRALAPVRNLEGIPVVKPGKAMQLVNASPEEFVRMVHNDAS